MAQDGERRQGGGRQAAGGSLGVAYTRVRWGGGGRWESASAHLCPCEERVEIGDVEHAEHRLDLYREGEGKEGGFSG
jgi:hypothetical protein